MKKTEAEIREAMNEALDRIAKLEERRTYGQKYWPRGVDPRFVKTR